MRSLSTNRGLPLSRGAGLLALGVLLSLSTSACDRRVLWTGGDGGWAQDSGVASDSGATADSQRPADALAPGRVTVVLDKGSYAVFDQPRATIVNGTQQTIFVDGCSALSAERYESGAWVDKGGGMDCFWPGLARQVAPGASMGEPLYFGAPGRWRAKLRYGLGCNAEQPFPGGCKSEHLVRSAEAQVKTNAADCDKLAKDYAQRLKQAQACYDPSSCTLSAPASLACGCDVPINVGKAGLLSSLIKRWKELSCHMMFGDCPAIACEAPLPAECSEGRCATN
jgi:hypothetical protein